MKRLGPDLKMPDLKSLKGFKPPAAVGDVYYDLRDRRLLPLVALVVVAIVAVPFLLGGDAEKPAPPLSPAPGAALEEGAGAQSLTVIEANPGLRDYRKRLEGRTATDPFKQRYTGVPPEAQLESSLGSSDSPSASSSASGQGTVVEDDSTAVEVEPEGPAESGGGGEPGAVDPDGGGNSSGVRLIEFRFDIEISRTELAADGSRSWTEPQVRRQVPSLTQLPEQKTVATVGGINAQNGKVFLLVSDDVKSLGGKFVCTTRTGGGLCELLELEVGALLELVSAPNDVRYRIKVLRIDAVEAGRARSPEPSPRAGFAGPVAKFLP